MYFKNFRTCKSACKYFSPMQLSELCLHLYNAAFFSPKRWQSIYSFQWILLCFQLEKWESEHLCVLSQPRRVLWTIAHQAPLSMEFWQEHWTGLPFPPPGDLSCPGIEPASPAVPILQMDSLRGMRAYLIFREKWSLRDKGFGVAVVWK